MAPTFAGGIAPAIKPGTSTVPAMLAASQLTSAVISFSNTGANTLVSVTTAQQTIRVFRMLFIVDAATSVTVMSGSTALSGALSFVANQGLVLDFSGDPWYTTAAGEAFILSQSGTALVAGTIWYAKS